MNKVWLIIKREYWMRAFTKRFFLIAFMLILPTLPVVIGGWYWETRIAAAPLTQRIAVLAYHGDERLYQQLVARLQGTTPSEEQLYQWQQQPRFGRLNYELVAHLWQPGEAWEAVKQRLDRGIAKGDYSAYIVATPAVFRGADEQLLLYTKATSRVVITQELEKSLRLAVRRVQLLELGVAETQLQKIENGVRLTTLDLNGEALETTDSGEQLGKQPVSNAFAGGPTITLPQAEAATRPPTVSPSDSGLAQNSVQKLVNARLLGLMTVAIWMYLLQIFSSQVVRGVAEEKGSRIVEVLLSSVNSFQLMLGKLLGISFVSLTQIAIYIVLLVGTAWLLPSQLVRSARAYYAGLAWYSIALIVLFFVLSYLLCATASLIVGALSGPEADASFALRFVLIIFTPTLQSLLMIWAMSKPQSSLLMVLSLVPGVNVVLMPLRIAFYTPPWWQVISALILLSVTIYGAVYVAAKIYRVSLLAQGGKPTLRQLRQWLQSC